MRHANERRESPYRRRTRIRAPRVARPAEPAPAQAGLPACADTHPARDAVRRGTAPCRNPRRARGAGEGAAPLNDARDRQTGGAGPAGAQAPSDRPQAGDDHRDPEGGGAAPGGAAGEGGVAGPAAGGADAGGEGDPPVGRADSGEALQNVGGLFRSLRNYNFRLFAAGGVISNVGTWMQRTAQDWLVLDLTRGSGSALGITVALQFLPVLLFGLWGGMIADRYPKRRVLIVAQSLMGLLALVMGVLVLSGTAQVWHVYVMAFLLGCVSCVEVPTRQSFVVEMVGRKDLPNAIALNSSSFNLARVVGPAVAGLLIHWLGTGPIYMLNAVSFAAVIAGLAMMRTAELHTPEPVKRAKGQLREGFRYV